ncbi:MAG: hypothetical protein EA412_12490, partial [Chitinophagaceae bacterium]
MESITLKPVIHKNERRVLCVFRHDESILHILKNTFPEIKWSQTHKSWHVEDRSDLVKKLFQSLQGKMWIDYSAMRAVKKNKQSIKKTKARPPLSPLSSEHLKKLESFRNYLQSKRYSPSTVKTYTEAISVFLRFFSKKKISDINNQDIVEFNNQYILKNNYSSSYQNQFVNGLKLFLKVVENKVLNPDLIHRPKREKTIPNVLSKEEVKRILEAPVNIKHQTMLSLIYACGLRRSELLNLKLTDVDSNRKLLI